VTPALPDYQLTGDGPQTIVFLHGLGGDLTNWQPQVDYFSAKYRCLRWTLPGYGTSAPLPHLTWPNLAAALADVLDEAGVDRAAIVGMSMGGFIAQQFAADHGDRVESLVLAGTTAQFGRGSTSFAEEFLRTRLKPVDDGASPADFAATVVQNLLSPNADAAAVANATASMSRISSDAYRQALTCVVTWNFVDRLSEIQAPTLCIAGSNDQTAPVAALQALTDGLPSAQLAVIDDCQHLINLDRPGEFNTLVDDFVTRPPAKLTD